ncbi:hypothetical protein OIY81_1612 [Cryptosporidium canis]|uniref:UBA domain-containing protein n=1 Tax=Cryptosporidium canis TaxID=195482 RepID=A0ABQ8P1P5_9CRYT|nr:hypothetical protein OJ252_3657 [Cryptosporidium canis]KAJ1611695.1 hypothetical protein OIY81_1612 [Cryptosporidium canis]
MSHLLIKYFEDLNPSFHNVSFFLLKSFNHYFKIKYLCDEIIRGSFDCGRDSYENTNFEVKLSAFKDLKSSKQLIKDMGWKNEEIQSLSEMLNAANKAKQIVNSLKK